MMNDEQMTRYEQLMGQFQMWRNLSTNTAASIGEIMSVAVASAACLFMITVAVTWWRAGWPDLPLSVVVAMVPIGVMGVGGVLITMRLITWKIQWWGEWITEHQSAQEQRAQPEQLRIIRLRERSEINGVDTADLAYFLRAAYSTHDWSQKAWRGKALPSGRPCHDDYWRELIEVLLKVGILQDYGPRKKGYLVGTCEEALAKLQICDLVPASTDLTATRDRFTHIDTDRGRG